MSAFGFPWPDMLDCNRFPVDNDLCIPSATSEEDGPLQEEPQICEACKAEGGAERSILTQLCNNDFVLKIKVKEISYLDRDAMIIPEGRSRLLYGPEGWTDSGDERLELWLPGGSGCTCDELRDLSASYLLTGRKQAEGRLLVTSIRHWRGGKRELRKMTRSFKKARC
ncbi:hypothetical protein chiPu_0019124 [Chiloscyllium punctatum]|uniref:NTR domain-containing protein n=2 Tax=Chiloscyllium punctatum TaxID=137246 RepID=A0A401RQY3_CHIPU|nr:hypothetical protein [Chiloscyllium punctatum]